VKEFKWESKWNITNPILTYPHLNLYNR
jgi:hypothetical protein